MDAWWASSVGSLPVLGWMGRRWVAPQLIPWQEVLRLLICFSTFLPNDLILVFLDV